jgi:hypothetical protein
VRLLACAAALDALAELWIHENKGTGDLDALEPVAHRFCSGIDDDSIAYAAESLHLLRAECEKRGPRIKALDPRICPEKRVTREIAAKASLRLRPIVAIFDEVQNVMMHPSTASRLVRTPSLSSRSARPWGSCWSWPLSGRTRTACPPGSAATCRCGSASR